MKSSLLLAILPACLAAAAPPIDIAPVWSGHPVGFDLLTHEDRQFVAFYDAERHMTVGSRTLESDKWRLVRLPSDLKWDSHNSVTFALDRDGYIHLSGNMHVAPLVYFRTRKPFDIDTFERVPGMTGQNEQRCTYPHFFYGTKGELIFTYRDGKSGNGDQIFNVYDEKTRAWRRLMDKPLTDGQNRMNAYFQGPVRGPDGWFHMVWVWRNTPDCSTNHDLSYARSRDLVHWESSAGKPFALPIRVEQADIVDPVPPHGGIINGNTRIGFDSQKRPVITYHKFDKNGFTQICNARLEDGRWKVYQTSDWDYRWDPQGGGSIRFEITHGAVQPAGAGRLMLDYGSPKAGSGTWILDEATLQPVGKTKRTPAYPPELTKPESDFPGMEVRFRGGSGYFLRWETLGPNRDRPREGPLPKPSMLRIYKVTSDRATITEGAYGRLETSKATYRPLETVTVRIQGRAKGDSRCTLTVADPEQREYVRKEVELKNNRGTATFTAAGRLGVHYIYLTFAGEKRRSRYLNFRLDAATSIQTGKAELDELYPLTEEMMQLGRREYNTPRGKFVGYISADTNHFDGIWLRDWIYGLPGYRYWERDMQCGLDRFLEAQGPNGQIPDGIERSGKTWRVGLESDVEYIMTVGVWQTWQVTGDDDWLKRALPKLEKALAYITSDPKHWDPDNRLIKRQHSCDTWDYDIDGASDTGAGRHVIATCDQSGYALAYRAMSDMYRHLGNNEAANKWLREAGGYRSRANKLLWNGDFFLHHVHLDPSISHGDFDETKQLAMGNTWAMTRGLADPAQAARIIDEYRRRRKTTGDAYPWWSLQPGYPDSLGYWKDAYRKQGAYANGGLMPWVGGELCRAAFRFGRESYGAELLRQYTEHLRRTGGAQVWYFPDGEPGFRTVNEVRYAGWGMAQWIEALIEGLAGIRETDGQMRNLEVSPRWVAAGVDSAAVSVRYASANSYFAYRMDVDRATRTIAITHTGSSPGVTFRVLLPAGWQPQSAKTERIGDSVYAVIRSEAAGLGTILIR